MTELYGETKKRLEDGEDRGEVERDLVGKLAVATTRGDSTAEEEVMDVLDAMYGWCAPTNDLREVGR